MVKESILIDGYVVSYECKAHTYCLSHKLIKNIYIL